MTNKPEASALTRFAIGDHITDEECIMLLQRFNAIVKACEGFPDYRIVVSDALQHRNRLESMLDGRRQFPETRR